jgi:hypothetical protein
MPTMRHLSRLAVGAGLMTALAMAQQFKPLDDVPWKPSKVSALALAKKVDASLGRLRGIHADTTTVIRYDGQGRSIGVIDIKDSKTFAARYAYVHYPKNKLDRPISGNELVANGQVVEVIGAQTPRANRPVQSFRLAAGRTVADWVTGMPRYILGGIHGENALTSLIQMAARPGSGYKVSVKERIMPAGQYRLPQNQIVITRDAAAAKKFGPVKIEVVVDAHRLLPVGATTMASEKGRKPMMLGWLVQWDMRPKTFQASMFTLPSKRLTATKK